MFSFSMLVFAAIKYTKKGVNEMQKSNLEVNLGPIIKYNRK